MIVFYLNSSNLSQKANIFAEILSKKILIITFDPLLVSPQEPFSLLDSVVLQKAVTGQID
jgi:hypothetical protein